MVLGTQPFDENIGGFLRVDGGAAGKDVNGGVPVFRPGMDGKVRFGDDDNAANSLGTETMERIPQDDRPAFDGGGQHGVPEKVQVVQYFPVTIVQLNQKMSAQRVQSQIPL
jgi:hypothetical protein